MTTSSKVTFLVLFASLLLRTSALPSAEGQASPTIENPTVVAFENGRWFDGTSFAAENRYSADGVLSEVAPDHVDMTIDLKGQWVAPPYGDAPSARR